MPGYIRKNVSYTPPSLYNVRLEDDNDYILDPDQLRDILPQPYRMINKILTQILDDTWDIVNIKHNALLAEAHKVCPPKCDEPEELSIYSNATALAESVDGKYIFVGLPNGLAVMDVMMQAQVYSWEEKHTEIGSIETHKIVGTDGYLIVTVDDMAVARIFLFAFDHIFFVKAFNQNPPEATSKTLCHKCESSKNGDYAGILLENTGTKEVWLEIHKLPVDHWIKEFEGISNAFTQKKEEEKKQLLVTEVSDENYNKQGHHPDKMEPAQPQTDSVKSDEPMSQTAFIEHLGVKFSQPGIILKVNSPKNLPFSANSSTNVASAIGKVDTGDSLGTGIHHVLRDTHLESRDAMFSYRHEAMLKYIPKEKEKAQVSATFHFVNASRIVQFGLDTNTPEDTPVTLMVWWAGSPHISQYSLIRAEGKDSDSKPGVVWPFTCALSCTAVSPCSAYLAVGLTNGNIVLWDRQLGLDKAVLSLSTKSALKAVRFLDPCLFPVDPPHYPPYPVYSATFLLAESEDGVQSLYDTCDGSVQIPRVIATEPENDDTVQILLKVIPGLPDLMIYVQKNGSMFIKDIGTGAALCQVVLPSPYSLQTPWDPKFAFGAGGQFLFVKAEGTDVSEDGEICDLSCVYKYNLRSFSVLESYWKKGYQQKELMVYTKHEDRLKALMQERLQQQCLRKPRMQCRWGELRSELIMRQQARAVPVDTLVMPF